MKRKSGLLLMLGVLTLAACGGGGGDDPGFGRISLSASATSATAITLTWSEPGGSVSVSPYIIARNDSASGSTIGSTTARTYVVAGLSPGTRYCFVIKNPLTRNTMSNTACVTMPADNSPPTTPTGLTTTAVSPAEVALSWTASSDDNRVAGYNLFRDGQLLYMLSAIATVDRDVIPGDTYCYTVSAYDDAGNASSQSAESCTTLPADTEDPTAPTALTAEFSTAGSQPGIALAWIAATDDGVISHYRVYRNDAYLADAELTSFDDYDLQADTSYCYQISAVDAAGRESLRSDQACAREGFQVQPLGAFDAIYSDIALDSNDVPQIAYKQYTFDSSLGETRYPLSLIQLAPGTPVSPQLIAEGTDTFFFNDAYLVAIAVDTNNTVHLAHKLNEPPQAEQIQYVQVSAGSTAKSTLRQSMNQMGSIALAVDSSGAVHACYDIDSALYYANNIGGTWTSEDVSTFVPGLNGHKCDLAIDSDDRIHISFLGRPNSDLLYLSDASGGWEVDVLDLHSGTPVGTSTKTSIAIDNAGHAHIAYFHDFADNDLEYATNASGVWMSSKIDADGDVGYDCDIAVDSSGNVHIVYEDHNDSTLLMYATNDSGPWTTDTLATVGIGNAAIAIDSLDRLHVTYPDADNQLTYSTNRD